MIHPAPWYIELAKILDHPGYVTLAEVRQQEARLARAAAATTKWHRNPVGLYWTTQDDARYTVIREHGKRTWEIEVWPLGLSHPRYGRTQPGIRTLTEAKGLALAMPCFRCGLAAPLILMTRRMPARPSLMHLVTERWVCTDTGPCEAERDRITGKGEGPRIDLTALAGFVSLVLPGRYEEQPYSTAADLAPDCPASLVENLEDRHGR